MEKASCRLLFFVKQPLAGKVKTRLAAEVGECAAVELYKSFILNMISAFDVLDVKVNIFVYPADGCGWFERWLEGGYSYFGQSGLDLGERMKNAFEEVFGCGVERVVLVGSDVPELGASYIREALESLETCDAVIGPAFDGGYYLIGFGRGGFLPEVFDNIEWSTDKVFAQSIEILREHGRKIHVMGEMGDIDTAEDLGRFVRGYEDNSKDSATISYIMEKKLLPFDDISPGDIVNE